MVVEGQNDLVTYIWWNKLYKEEFCCLYYTREANLYAKLMWEVCKEDVECVLKIHRNGGLHYDNQISILTRVFDHIPSEEEYAKLNNTATIRSYLRPQ